MIHFNAEFLNNHQLCVLHVLNVKETNLVRKVAKKKCRDTMKIRRWNYVATMDFYVATLPEKLLKKNVATIFCYVVTMIKAYGSAILSKHSNLFCYRKK